MTQTLETTTQLESIKAIENGLAAFDEQKTLFEELAESAKELDITDVNDKVGLKAVTAKRIELKNARVKVTKEGKLMRDYLNPITKFISQKEKELIAITEPEEMRLAGLEQWFEDELKRIEDERIAAENERIQKRIDALQSYGFEIDFADLKAMTDETFEIALSGAKSEYEKEQAAKAEQERIEAEEVAQRKRELETEQARIAAERKELEELREKQAEIDRKQKEAQDKIDAENKRIADEKAAIEAAKQKEIEDQRLADLKKLEDERIAKEIEAERLTNLPEKKKIESYIAQVMSVPVPELKTAKSKKIMADIQVLMNKVNEFSKQKVTTL